MIHVLTIRFKKMGEAYQEKIWDLGTLTKK